MTEELELSAEQREWLAGCFEGLTTELEVLTPSRWAEAKRYLPPSATAMPGFYRFEVAPYLREIVDSLGVESPVRELAIMKGVQLGLTVGVLENLIGYFIDHVRNAPVMLVTADAELANIRVTSYIIPMLQFSGLDHLIQSADEKNARKTGRTDKKIEWIGGGFLIPFGAQNANKLRSISIQALLRDEIDGWPDVVGKDGDPLKLSADRCAAYESSRKILDISTPLIKGQSKIEKRFRLGDQRHYYVCCLRCGFPQVLKFKRTDTDGVISGVVWETERGVLVPDSVRYLCQNCSHPHTNDDKTRLLAPEHGAEWRPTAEPASPDIRSYHISALYSPVGMQTWTTCVQKWLEAWDVERNRVKDVPALQVFYNNVLGETFEIRGERLTFEVVSSHRRKVYRSGEIPNGFAVEFCGGPVLVVVCTVDVHGDNLSVATWGWCRDRRVFLIAYERYEGDTEQVDNPATWGRLTKLIEEPVAYKADDGKRYPIALTLIDSGYRADTVYQFCAQYERGVYPIKGQAQSPKAAKVKEFSEFTTPLGTIAYGITVDIYKERWSAALKRTWNGLDLQPDTAFFNAPGDLDDKPLKELTVEKKVALIDQRTKLQVGWEWQRPSGAANELWDLLCYANAALDLVAWNLFIGQLERDSVDWREFYDLLEREQLFFPEA